MQVRATRLSQPESGRTPFLAKPLPPGSIQRKLIFWVATPLLVLLLAVLVVDKAIMPSVTRQGTEFPLPSLMGQRLVDAQISLYELDLKYEIAAQEYSPGKPQGVILGQFPISGTKVKSDRTIKLTLSMGQKMIEIPDVAGRSVRQAILDLETAGLIVGEIAWAFSDTIPERVVVFSYPAAGSNIPMGSSVNLMVNRGRASSFTFVPKVIGLPLEEARKRLKEKSLLVGEVTTRIDENYLPETVLEQSEPEGAELDINSQIDLVVSSS